MATRNLTKRFNEIRNGAKALKKLDLFNDDNSSGNGGFGMGMGVGTSTSSTSSSSTRHNNSSIGIGIGNTYNSVSSDDELLGSSSSGFDDAEEEEDDEGEDIERGGSDGLYRRKQHKCKRSLVAGASGTSGSSGPLNTQLPPQWVDVIDTVEVNMIKTHELINQLNQLHSNRLKVTFEDEHEVQTEKLIDVKTREITALFRTTEQNIKRLGLDNRSPRGGGELSQAELAVRNNIQRALAKRIQVLSVQFRRSQKEYLTKLRAQQVTGSIHSHSKAGGKSNSNSNSNSTGRNPLLDFLDSQQCSNSSSSSSSSGGIGIGSNRHGFDVDDDDDLGGGFTSAQLMITDDVTQLVDERDAEIVQIAESIEELAAIFKELAAMVIDQGTVLDRIDYNMEQTIEHAREGVTQLEQAEQTQKSSLGPKCIIALCCVIAILILILWLKHRS